MRDGWKRGSSYLLFDSGPHGSLNCGHAHADALAIEYAAAGRQWLIDPGTFTYTGDARLRDWFRSTEAHNTVTVDGGSQSISAGPFSWEHIARSAAHEFIEEDSFAYLEGLQDGYRRLADPVMHSRSVLFIKSSVKDEPETSLPSYLVIRDRFTASESHTYTARFHFPPEIEAESRGSIVRATDCTGNCLSIEPFSSAALKARVEEGQVSRAYGARESALVGTIELEGRGPQELLTFIIASGAKGAASVEELKSSKDGCPAFAVSLNNLKDVIATGDGKSRVECEGVITQGSITWARFDNQKFVRGCLIRGKRIEIENDFALESPTNVRCLAVEMIDGQIEITIHEASRFDLSFRHPRQVVTVNKARFYLHPNSRTAGFIREGSGWRLVKED
jgi:uncharacterized protein (UPF0262 family)